MVRSRSPPDATWTIVIEIDAFLRPTPMFNARKFLILPTLAVYAAHAITWSAAGDERSLVPLPRVEATSPEQAAATLQFADGFRAELIAAEPLVTDPIAMQYDENGLAYVIEMNDYPYSDKSYDQSWTDQKSPAIGRVRVLEDTNGDGKFDKSTVFADHLSWPSGIAIWQGGIYVAATPNVWYLKDLDGAESAYRQALEEMFLNVD